MPDTRPATPGKLYVDICPACGEQWTAGEEELGHICAATESPPEPRRVEVVPRHQPEPGKLEERLEGMAREGAETVHSLTPLHDQAAREFAAHSILHRAGVPDLLAQVSELETERDQLREQAERLVEALGDPIGVLLGEIDDHLEPVYTSDDIGHTERHLVDEARNRIEQVRDACRSLAAALSRAREAFPEGGNE